MFFEETDVKRSLGNKPPAFDFPLLKISGVSKQNTAEDTKQNNKIHMRC